MFLKGEAEVSRLIQTLLIPTQTHEAKGEEKVLTPASSAKSQFEPLCLTCARRAKKAICRDQAERRPPRLYVQRNIWSQE